MKIAFWGSLGEFSEIYLRALKEAGFEMVLEVRSKSVDFGKVAEEIDKLKPDLGIIAYFGKIIPKEILKIPARGFLNIHPSLLPRWRGPSPVQAALLAGDKKTGVTIHIATEKFDAGPILAATEVPIHPNDTYLRLTERLAKEGAKLLIVTLERWFSGEIKTELQDESKATYSKFIKTEDGKIDWSRSAKEIDRQIRALNPEPGTFTFLPVEAGLDRKRLIILDSQVVGRDGRESDFQPGKIIKYNNSFVIATKDGVLKPLRIKLEGKKETTPEAFLRGYPQILHAILT